MFRYWRSMFFNENAILALKAFASWKFILLNFLLLVFFQAAPLTQEDLVTFPFDYIGVLWKILLATFVVLIFAKLFGSKITAKKYLYVVSVVNLFASILSALLAYLSLFVFEFIFDNPVFSNIITSILPFYLIVLFAFSSDVASELEGWRSALLGFIAVILLYSLYYFL